MMENAVEDIGTLLKNRREKLSRSLDDAAQQTRIRKNYLESIENNRFSELPGPVYVTGFIKVYTQYLGLNSSTVLAMLEELPQEVERPLVKPTMVARHQPIRAGKSAAGSKWKILILGLFAVLLLGVTAIESPAPQAIPTMNSATTEPGVNSATQETAPNPGLAAPVVEEPNSLPIVPPEGGSLRMLATAESSLVIYLDDREPHDYKLYDGLDLTWKVRQKVRIEMAGPHVARFWLDGQELDLGDLESFELDQVAGE